MAKLDNHKIIFEKALLLIRTQACEGVSIDEILAALPVSRSTVERLFKMHLGHSPRAELVCIRIEHAKTFLTSTDLPIKQIGQRIGYTDVANFNRFFRNCTGVTPQQFRSRNNNRRVSKQTATSNVARSIKSDINDYRLGSYANAAIGPKKVPQNAANRPNNEQLFL